MVSTTTVSVSPRSAHMTGYTFTLTVSAVSSISCTSDAVIRYQWTRLEPYISPFVWDAESDDQIDWLPEIFTAVSSSDGVVVANLPIRVVGSQNILLCYYKHKMFVSFNNNCQHLFFCPFTTLFLSLASKPYCLTGLLRFTKKELVRPLKNLLSKLFYFGFKSL